MNAAGKTTKAFSHRANEVRNTQQDPKAHIVSKKEKGQSRRANLEFPEPLNEFYLQEVLWSLRLWAVSTLRPNISYY